MQLTGDALAGAPLAGSAPAAAAVVAAAATVFSGEYLVLEARAVSVALDEKSLAIKLPSRDVQLEVNYD